MAKTSKLAELSRDWVTPRNKDAFDKLQESKPEQHKLLIGLVEEWVNGECQDKFPTITTFARFLVRKKLISVNVESTVSCIRKRFPDAG